MVNPYAIRKRTSFGIFLRLASGSILEFYCVNGRSWKTLCKHQCQHPRSRTNVQNVPHILIPLLRCRPSPCS